MIRRAFIFFAIYFTAAASHAQQNPSGKITVKGRMSLEMRYYNNSTGAKLRPPFVIALNAQPEFRIGKWVVPSRISLGSYNKSYRDFNRFGISPRYKWITLHAGHTTLNWSRYVLESRPVLGGGFELSPGRFRLGAYAGIVNKAFAKSTYNARIFNPQYTRKMAAAKLGYVWSDEDAIELTALTASDNPNSLDSASAGGLLDAANGVVSLRVAKQLGKRLYLDASVGASAYTEDRTAKKSFSTTPPVSKAPSAISKTNASTIYANAYFASLQYRIQEGKNIKDVVLGLEYERIDPGYRSMGIYYLIDDIQRGKIGFQFSNSSRKFFLATNLGVEENNVAKTQLMNNRRMIAGINFNYRPSSNWNWNGSLMNYSIRLAMDGMTVTDSLVVNQANRSANIAAQGMLGKGQTKNSLTLTGGYQSGKNIMGTVQTNLAHLFFDGRYRLNNWSRFILTPGFAVNNYKTTGFNSTRYIPSVAAEKSFKQKFTLQYNTSAIVTFVASKYALLGWQNMLSGNWNINPKNSLNSYIMFLNNFAKGGGSSSELQLSVRYGLRF